MEFLKVHCLDQLIPPGHILRMFRFHVDDTQLFLSMKPKEINQLTQQTVCRSDKKTWKHRQGLLLNLDITKVIVLGPNTSGKFFLWYKWLKTAVNVVNLASSTTVKNLRALFDQDLSFNTKIQQFSSFFSLMHLHKNPILSQTDAETLHWSLGCNIISFLLSRMCFKLFPFEKDYNLRWLRFVPLLSACAAKENGKSRYCLSLSSLAANDCKSSLPIKSTNHRFFWGFPELI